MNIKKIISFILSAALTAALCGCGKSSDKPVGAEVSSETFAKGEYTEKNISQNVIPEGCTLNSFYTDKDENVFFCTADENGVVTVYDQSGTATESGWLNENPVNELTDVFRGGDGNIYAYYVHYTDTEISYKLIRASDGGKTAEDVTPPEWADIEFLNNVCVGKDGSVAYYNFDKNGISRYNGSDSVNADLGSGVDAFASNGAEVYYINLSNAQICSYNFETHSDGVAFNTDFKLELAKIALSDNYIYVVSPDGIYRRTFDGTLWEKISSGNSFKFSLVSSSPYSVAAFDNGDIYASYYSTVTNSFTVCKYFYDESVSTPETKITVYSMWQSAMMKECIARYSDLHPEIKIEYTIAYDGTAVPASDRIRELNTELMSGNGADILLLNGLPAESYRKKGVLEDMTDVFKPMLDGGELLDNIADNYVFDGKIYYMPVQFGVPLFLSDSAAAELEPSPEGLADFARSCVGSGRTLFSNSDSRQVFEGFIYEYYDRLFKTDGNFDKAAFIGYMENVKAITDSCAEGPEYEANIKEDELIRMMVMSNLGSPSMLMGEDTHAILRCSRCIDDCNAILCNLESFDINFKNINNTFVPNTTVAINSDSESKDAAKEFIRFMFSDEIQSYNLYEGYPVSKSAFDFTLSSTVSPYGDAILSMDYTDKTGASHMLDFSWPKAEALAKFKEYLLNADKPVFDDVMLTDMLYSAAEGYFNGSTDIEAAADNAESSVNLYLSEQS